MFSSGGLGGQFTGSLFGQAAAIWQELNFRACSNGSLETNDRPILRYSPSPRRARFTAHSTWRGLGCTVWLRGSLRGTEQILHTVLTEAWAKL